MIIISAQCDVCRNTLVLGRDVVLTSVNVKRLLKENDWMIEDGKELCPDCSERVMKLRKRTEGKSARDDKKRNR